ncbi:MAG: ribose-phosphate pyrophosphokinase [Edafosvirus sp.]|uniref:Ribose-phosphate pyrophosphokinase n=1 Tax=Edafosvirus sp. TaxID=2487765 RepID=A0A3G4ZTS5_9VIRU|nr:MAG: ribose-phosphate pyrophosphokinase [Edafosvirus sp.]
MQKLINLTLSPTFQPIANSPVITIINIIPKLFKFSGGEQHIKLDDPTISELKKAKSMYISHQLSSSSAVMETLIATDAVRRINKNIKINLICPYFPYARQDRIMVAGESFTLDVFTKLINSQNYESVTIMDPHSDVCSALINNVNVIDNCAFAKECLNDVYTIYNKDNVVLVSPDAGTYKKIYNVAKYCNFPSDKIINGCKIRDVSTGRIIKTGYLGDVKDKICVIVDDIIDAGSTFIELANILKKDGAIKVILIVTHGIFSKGFECLKCIDKIYTTDSFKTFDENILDQVKFVKQIKLSINSSCFE